MAGTTNSALLRPGVAVGRYPQREDVRDNMLDRAIARINGMARQLLRSRGRGFDAFIRQVDAAAMGLDALSEQELSWRTRELRRRMYSEGLKDPLVAEAFALVREVAGRRLGMRHYDVQLFGGRVMLEGMIAEMETGEGKTMTATLPACAAALAGIPVHIVTVNDFLVARDAEWMGPIYRAFGLSVSTILEGMSLEERRAAYACDITYCTNKQLTFDYLKDRLLLGQENRPLHLQVEGLHKERPRSSRLLLRGLCFAIVDEADSVLIDEARTPLIISNKGDTSQEEGTYRDAITIARQLVSPRDFTVRPRDRQVELTDFGKARARKLARPYGGIWSGRKRRDDLLKQALAALHLYQIDKDYLLKDGKVQIIDEYTGRVMEDRSWERGLHQMIETKEGYAISGRQETLARISYQRFFRRYLRVAGMTGTAREVAGEMWAVYRLNVVRIPTNRPLQRVKLPQRIYATADQKWHAILERIRELHRQGRPVLIGTRSVAASEHLGTLLRASLLPHQVLNARQDQEEAQVVAQAGRRGAITVATNMAGRGTDIRLDPGVAELGGLHVLGTERHEAARIDRQLFGRGGRQGDPGSYELVLSIEDELVTDYFGKRFVALLARMADKSSGRLPGWLGVPVLSWAQLGAELHHGAIRRDLLKLDDNLGDMLAFSGRAE
ncbi:MAG: preprotein translocase subunit SecA [Gammaproteobacteria bacterium]